ncbi:MAG: hypothetical protein ACREJD_17150 [Phycisphaerales bacterium]
MSDESTSNRRRTSRLDPVPMFFGPTGPGPFALLGIDAVEIEPSRVLEALHARLARLARHPQSATPAGEEVNLALHAAAAQLCDPAIRRVLLRIWGDGTETAYINQRARVDGNDDESADIERELHLAIGLSGGWNARAMERLAIACQSKGVELADAIRAVQWASHARRGTPASLPSVRRLPGREHTRSPNRKRRRSAIQPPAIASGHANEALRRPARVIPRDALILIAISAAGFLCLATAIILLTPSQRPKLQSSTPPSAPLASAPLTMTPREPSGFAPTTESGLSADLEIGDPRAVTHEISGATQDLAADASAAHVRFARAYDAFGTSWTRMSADEISSVVSAVVDFCYGASRLETPAASTITHPLHESLVSAKAVRAAAASASIAGRLLSERELPRAFLDQIESGASIGANGSKVESSSAFRVGLERNLSGLASAIAASAPASADSWKGFVEVRDAAFGDRQPARDIAALNALELLLRNPSVPPRDLVRSIGVLAPALSWRPSDELRMALSGWLEDATVSSELLAEITRAMVGSSAPGVDSTMILPVGAGPEARSNLRERLAQAWQGKTVTSEREDFATWAAWAEKLLGTSPDSDASRLWTAARLSQASLAADALRAGKPDHAVEIIAADADAPTANANSAKPELPRPDPSSKALDYAAAGNSVQARLEVLKQVQSANARPDTLLADVLVTESARGTPASIRDLARSELRRHVSEPAIVLAVIRLLPSIPETPENAEWVSEVAGSAGAWKKRPKWKDAAQGALLDRAITFFPVSSAESLVDIASGALSDSWMERSAQNASAKETNPGVAIDALESSMASEARASRGAPSGLNVADIRRRLAARSEIAPGPLERAVAKQAACVEWTALSVAHERLGDIGAVQQLVEQWNAARRRAASSTEQLFEGEKVMLRLQLLRIGRKGKAS